MNIIVSSMAQVVKAQIQLSIEVTVVIFGNGQSFFLAISSLLSFFFFFKKNNH